MSVQDLKYQIEEAAAQVSSIGEELGDLEELEEAMELWGEVENEFGTPDIVLSELRELNDIRQVFDLRGHLVESSSDVVAAIDKMVAESSPQGGDKIVTAINLLLSTLIGAGVLPGMQTVLTSGSTEEPAVADNVVSAAPFFTNQPNSQE
jgi:hypothetical protein